jgi:putative sigma-54 modulation protein
MDVEYTGRQTVVTNEMRALTVPFLDRMEKMLGNGGSAHVVVTTEKHRQIAEVTVKTRLHDLVGLCESTASAETALRQALEKTEAQAVRLKEKRASKTRLPKDAKAVVEPALERPGKNKRTGLLNAPDSPLDAVLGMASKVAKPHASNGQRMEKPQPQFSNEPHITRAIDAIALRPMSLEEAVKEMATRNREIFVFRDKSSLLRVLHCRRDGMLELIELP